jgi:hypothetical protein
MFLALVSGRGEPPNKTVPAKLLEAVEYEPCDYYCGPLNHPSTAYCVEADRQILVGTRPGFLWFGENDITSGRDLIGRQITVRFDQSAIWISKDGEQSIKINAVVTSSSSKVHAAWLKYTDQSWPLQIRPSAPEIFRQTRFLSPEHKQAITGLSSFGSHAVPTPPQSLLIA